MCALAEGMRQAFEAAGWEVGEPVGEEAERLEMAVRGEVGKYTITAHRSVLVLDDPMLEFCDKDRSRVAWVRKIPASELDAELLARYWAPTEESVDTGVPARHPPLSTGPEEEDRRRMSG